MNQIIIKKLYESEDNKSHYQYSEEVERTLCKMLFGDDQVDQGEISQGYAPEWDVKLKNGITIEIKIQSSTDCFFETEQRYNADDEHWRPSGLSLSKADYWLLINYGRSAKNGIYISKGKIRLFKTADIREKCSEIETYTTYETTRGKKISSFDIAHVWAGDVPIISENKKLIGYNLYNFNASWPWKKFKTNLFKS